MLDRQKKIEEDEIREEIIANETSGEKKIREAIEKEKEKFAKANKK
jgi:hypothetical protein